MAVTNNFSSSALDLNGKVVLNQPTALVWGADGRLYITEVDGEVKVLTVAFGDPTPGAGDNLQKFYVTGSTTIASVKAIQNHNDTGVEGGTGKRQSTGLDVTPQFDAGGNPLYVQANGSIGTTVTATRAVTMYVTSSDSRIGAGGGGGDTGLDTNSGTITMLVQTGANTWDAIDIVRGLPRSEENHATNGLEVVQVLGADGTLVSERIIVAQGGNANAGAPSNNFAGQQEQPLSGAILEVNLSALKALPVSLDPEQANRKYVYDLPTLDDAARAGTADANDPFGGADGRNSATLDYDGIVSIYSPGYRNSYDVEVTDDGRVWTYDNGANNDWGGRPIGEAGDNGGTTDPAQAPGYVATNLNNGDGNGGDDINLVNWNPSNKDNFHEVTRSDDLEGGALSTGGNGAATTFVGPDGNTYVYGGHPNPTRAEGAVAGLLFSPQSGTDNAFLLVSNQDSYDEGATDAAQVLAWFTALEAANAAYPTTGVYGADAGELTSRVLVVTPGVLYDIYAVAGGGVAVVAGGAAPAGGTLLGQAGLPANFAAIVSHRNAVEGDYNEAGKTDGALDSGNGSINGLAEYTSTVLDQGGTKMSGAILATVLGGGTIVVMGRNADGTMSSTVSGGFAQAADRTTLDASGGPLGIATIGDDFIDLGLGKPFQGSIWTAVYSGNGPLIEIFQPDIAEIPQANSEAVDPDDQDLDGVDNVSDPFEFSASNGYALAAGQRILLDFDKTDVDPLFQNGSINDVGLFGAALDGTTPNQDAFTAAEGFGSELQRDGLFNDAGNLILGANAPILQIKNVTPGTAVGLGNTARDAMHTGVRLAPDVERLQVTLTAKNWIAAKAGGAEAGQLTGLMFGDGTQANFLRVVFGSVNGQPGLEVGFEIGDAAYTALARIAVPGLGNLATLEIDLRLSIDIEDGYAVAVSYRLRGDDGPLSGFVAVPLNGGAGFALPVGVLRNVLNGTHTISDGDTTLPSGAAIGIITEDAAGGTSLEAIDFPDLLIEGIGNEIDADTAAEVGLPGTPGIDTVVYTGAATNLAPLAADVENFDGSGSAAAFSVTGNALGNTFVLGAGANTVTTGAGADRIEGTLATLDNTTVTDFSIEDEVVIADATATGASVSYASGPAPGSAIVTVNGTSITFTGDDFADFDPADGASTFAITDTPDGMSIALVPGETVLYRVNAGGNLAGAGSGTIAALDGGPAWLSDAGLINATGPIALTGATNNTYTNALTNEQSEVTEGNVDLGVVPWQLFVNERSDNVGGGAKLTYTFDVETGRSYKITLFYTENWADIFGFAATSGTSRQFDVAVEGAVPAAFTDLNPLTEAIAAVGGTPPTSNGASNAQKQPYLGVALQREFVYTAGDDALTLEFNHDVENPKINAIQISVLGGSVAPPADVIPPVVASIEVSNEQGFADGVRIATVVLTDATGFDVADLAKLAPTFAGIVPSSVSAPAIALSNGGTTATLTYTLTAPAGGAWPAGATGQIAFATGAFEDAADNASAATSASFIIQPFLDALAKGALALAINVGATTSTVVNGITTWGGAITADPILGIDLQADNPSYYSPSSKTASNHDGAGGTTGSNPALDGSALHTYRDSANGSFTATYPVANGVYVVELWFAELFHATGGNRQGDYTINGEVLATNFDALTAAGAADIATKLTKTVVVTDGKIVVDVNADTGQPGFNAIVVYQAVDANLPPTISVADAAAVEGGGAVVTFSRTGDVSDAVTVTFTLAPGTATAADFGPPASFSVVIPANHTTATLTIPIADDAAEEAAETFTVSIASVSGGAVIGDGTAVVTIAPSDGTFQIPEGGTILALDFETAGEPLDEGGFDGVLGGAGALDAAAAVTVAGGKLVVNTSDGDLSQPNQTDSKNDFVRTVDLSDPALEDIYLTTRFDNPFTTALVPGGTIANYAQQGIVIAVPDAAVQQNADQFVKLVFGGNGGNSVQLWSQTTVSQLVPLTAISAAAAQPFGLADIASVELSLAIDKPAGTVGQFVTFFDADGAILGGVRPTPTPGFATAAPLAAPAPLLAALAAGDVVVGVHATDYNAFPSFPATWDFLTVTSPQATAGPAGTDAVRGQLVGDFSEDRQNPTDVALGAGSNVIQSTQQGAAQPGGRDYDYYTIVVPDGHVLSAINVEGFTGDITNQAFVGLVRGTSFPAPPASDADFAALAGQLLGGAIVNSDGVDLLPAMADGEVYGQTTQGFSLPLGPGAYTVWHSRNGGQTTVSLDFIVQEAPVAEITLSIAAAPTLVEAGDTGATDLQFVLTASDGFDGPVTVTYSAGSATGLQQLVTFVSGLGTLIVPVPNDSSDNLAETVTVTLSGAADGVNGFVLGTATATGSVTEDDAVDPADIDGDLILNGVDPAAYDASNGAPGSALHSLAKGATLGFEFNTPTANVLDGSSGLSGVMTTPSITPAASATDPYGILTNEATTSITADGYLAVDSSGNDTFTIGANATQNAGQDLYQVVMDVTANDRVRFETSFRNPFNTEPTQYSSLGLQIGSGDQDNYVKFVLGGNNGTGANGATRLQIGHNNGLQTSATNAANLGEQNLALSAALTLGTIPGLTDLNGNGSIDYNDLLQFTDTVKLAFEVDRSAAPQMTLKAFWEFFDAAGNTIASGTLPATGTGFLIKSGSELAAALNGQNPNFGGAGGVAFGVIHTDWDNNPLVDTDTFTAEFDYLRAISLDTPPANIPATVTAIDAGAAAETAAAVVIDLLEGAADSDGGTLGVTDVAVTDANGAPVAFTLDAASLTIDPAQFAAALGAGASLAVTVTFTVTDGQGGTTPNTATLLVDGAAGPSTFYRDADGDSYGDAGDAATGYTAPAGYVASAGDADDADAAINPAATEINDGKDNDQDGATDEDNAAPVAVADTASVAQGGSVAIAVATLVANDTDPDASDTLTVTAVGNAQNGTVSLATGVVTFTPDAGYSGPASFEYTVSDGVAANPRTATGTVGVTVTPTPSGTPIRIQGEDFDSATGYQVQPAATADGGQIIWVPGNKAGGSATYDLAANGIAPGTYRLLVAHYDENDGESTVALQIAGTGGVSFTESFVFDDDATSGTGTQAESRRIEVFENVTVGPDGVLTITGTRGGLEHARIDWVEFVPTGDGPDNLPPYAPAALPDVTLPETGALDLDLLDLVFDADDDELSFRVEGAGWLEVQEGRLVGNPGAGDIGTTTVTVYASDGVNPEVAFTFDLTVEEVNDAPATGGIDDQIVAVNQPITLDLADYFTDEGVLTFGYVGTLPAGVTFAEGVFSGTPTQPGSFAVTVTASDGEFVTETAFFFNVTPVSTRPTLRIEAEDFDLAPNGFFEETLSGGAGTVIRLGRNKADKAASYDLEDSGATGVYDIRIAFRDENDGVSSAKILLDVDGTGTFVEIGAWLFDTVTGTAATQLRIVSFPGVTIGPDSVLKLVATSNQGEQARIDYVELVPEAAEVNFAPTVLAPVGAIGQQHPAAVGLDLAAVFADPEDDALTFTIDSGQPWLAIVGGQLVGTPPGQGSYAITIGARDASGSNLKATTSFTITVAEDSPANLAPSVTLANIVAGVTEDTATRTKVADIVVTDDAQGANALGLTGADAALFEIDGLELFLKAGAGLDFETNPVLDVTVTIDDPAVGTAPDASATLALPVGDVTEGGPDARSLAGNLDGDATANAADTDIDNDGLVNLVDRAAYDATNAGQVLTTAGVIQLDFTSLADGASPFQAGFTGAAQTENGTAELNYATNGGAVVNNGRLQFLSTNADTNNGTNAFTFLAQAGADFRFEGVFDNPVFGGAPLATFSQYGLLISLTGAPGVTGQNFLKLVTGNPGDGFEISGRGSVTSADTKVPYPAGVTATGFAQVRLIVEADAATGTLTGKYELLDTTGGVIATGTVGTVTPTAGSALAQAIAGASGAPVPAFGITSTDFGAGGSFTVGVASLTLTDTSDDAGGGDPGDPGDALDVLASLTDVTTTATYGGAVQGAAELRIMQGNNDADASNFGGSSFQLSNTGGKKIAAIVIDVNGALYSDIVFDPDGAGGDSVGKVLSLDSIGTSGAFKTGTGYVLPGANPLPNTTGQGELSNGGFKGVLVKFDNAVSAGFQNGESVGFSVDMDPNSIAGLPKSGVDAGAIQAWDVGGVSGHEMIGATFAVLFDDGSTATGQLTSDGSVSGAQARAAQGTTAEVVGLSVNGTVPGGVGTYGGNVVPSVIVTGDVGDTVRITLTKGFNPVTNATNGIADLVADRLADDAFEANNAFDSQTVDVVIGANGSFDASGLFDYDDLAGNNTTKGGFTGDDIASIGFVAVAIDPATKFAKGPVTTPIYLDNAGGPVVGDPVVEIPGGGYYQIIGSGSQARFKVQIEDANGVKAGTNPGGAWEFFSAPDAAGRQSGFQGSGYYVYGSSTVASTGNVKAAEVLEYTIYVPEAQVGNYTFRFSVARDGLLPSDAQNDLWLNFKKASVAGFGEIEDYLTQTVNAAEPLNQRFVKLYGGTNNGQWGNASNLDGSPGDFAAQIAITEAGLYTVQIAGRSTGFHVDYWELFKGSAPAGSATSSAFVPVDGTGNDLPVFTSAVAVSVAENQTGAIDVNATDADGDTITYAVAGTDAALFNINATTGLLTFKTAPDFESPADAGGNNVYNVSITANDGTGTTTQALAVTVTNAAEGGGSTLVYEIATSLDDREANNASGTSADLEFGASAIGLRFTGIDIPDGAIIANAYLEFEAEATSTGISNLTIQIQNSEAVAAYTTSTAPGARSYLPTSVAWSALPTWTVGQEYRTPDLADLLQAIIGTNGTSNGSFGFLISGTGRRDAHAFDSTTGTAPRLVIELVDDTGTGAPGSTQAKISASSDDIELSTLPNGTIAANLTSANLEFGTDNFGSTDPAEPAKVNVTGMRFTGLTVPEGASIQSAYFIFDAFTTSTQASDFDIAIQNTTSATTFSSVANFNARGFVGNVDWVPGTWTGEQTYQSPDISALIEAVLGSGGLDATDSLAFKVSGTGVREAHSFDTDGGVNAPVLVINYDL